MDKVTHVKYGAGVVIEDSEGCCREGEVFVRFYNRLPFLKSSAIAGYSGQNTDEESMYEDRDIVSVSDLVEA